MGVVSVWCQPVMHRWAATSSSSNNNNSIITSIHMLYSCSTCRDPPQRSTTLLFMRAVDSFMFTAKQILITTNNACVVHCHNVCSQGSHTRAKRHGTFFNRTRAVMVAVYTGRSQMA